MFRLQQNWLLAGAVLQSAPLSSQTIRKAKARVSTERAMKHSQRHPALIKASAAGMAVLLLAASGATGHSPNASLSANEITKTLRGKVCSTRVGAKIGFGEDGQYSYEGLWKNGGRYTVGAGIITVTLDNGLERSFVISRKGDVFFMEQTALSCDRIGRSGN